MSRPLRRTERICFRLEPEKLAAYRATAKATGLTLTEWIERAANRELAVDQGETEQLTRKVRPLEERAEYLTELLRRRPGLSDMDSVEREIAAAEASEHLRRSEGRARESPHPRR